MLQLDQLLPPLNSSSNLTDPIVPVKLFTPDAAATWFLIEYDPGERLAFGWADLGIPGCEELGYISMDELDYVRGALDLKVEMDKFWQPCPLSEVTSGRRR